MLKALFLSGVCAMMMAGAACAEDAKAPDPGGVPFVFDNPIGGYDISGTWFPLVASDAKHGPYGPVVFELKDSKTGKVIKIAENGVSLLSDATQTTADLKPGTTLHLNYGEKDRAEKGTCESSKDTCLKLGDIPIDLQDLTFDGEPEVIIAQDGMGQRFGGAYRVYTLDLDDSDPKDELGAVTYNDMPYHEVFSQLDDQSTIDLTKKQIEIFSSGGACANSAEFYGLNSDGGFSETGFELWQDNGGKCMDQVYQVKTSDMGVQTWRMVSSKPAQE